MIKLLLVGDFSSIHMYNYVKNVIAYDNNLECTCLHFVDDEINPLYLEYYQSEGCSLVQGISTEVYAKQGAYQFTRQTLSLLKSLGHFDIMHLHAVRLFVCPALFLARKLYSKRIITYWGSDLYRSSKFKLIQTIPLISSSTIITMMSKDMLSYFSKLPWYIRRYSSKVKIMDIGNMFYEKIDAYKKNKEPLKKEFGINSQSIVCTIGYVGRKQMRQYETLESIKKVLEKHRDVIHVIIPAYGISDGDYNKIDSFLTSLNICYKIYKEFMDPDMVSKLRAVTDIFIHAQTTDALSCAMLEHLYAGCVVLNGSWLDYSVLNDINIYYLKFEDFNDLPEKLDQVINNYQKESALSLDNQLRIASISSWDSLRPLWLDLYN